MSRSPYIDETVSLRGFQFLEPSDSQRTIKELLEINADKLNAKEQANLLGLVTYLQFLAKLHLLANGHDAHADILPDIVLGDSALEFNAVMPWAFHFSLATSKLPTPALFHMDRFELITSDFKSAEMHDMFSVPVSISYVEMHMYPRTGIAFEDVARVFVGVATLPDDSFGLKRIAASFLLSGLLNYQTATRYGTDNTTLALVSKTGNNYAACLADMMIAGKIHACPHCSRPFVKLKESSRGYCSDSCRTLYNRAAKRNAMEDGASIETIHDAYPEISKKTIAEWFKSEGR